MNVFKRAAGKVSSTGEVSPKGEKEQFYQATPWQLAWWKFRKHRMAKLALWGLVLLYGVAVFCEFFSPYTPGTRFSGYQDANPNRVHIYVKGEGFKAPFIYKLTRSMDKETFRTTYQEDTTVRYPITFFAKGEPYKLWGLFEMERHLFTVNEIPILLFGTDRLGRCLFSRTMYGARISLTIGLVGISVSFALGLLLGGISGYFGGVVDVVIQRVIEFILSIPGIPLWMTLSAALPRNWPVVKTYFFITLILSLMGWCRLARQVRGKLLALREEDFVVAARLSGANEARILWVHLFPSFTSHLIVTLTLMIPNMILGETALSFIGLGMQPPAVSWGVLLQDSQNIVTLAHHPWKFIPCVFIIATVLMFNFLGDGIRDAADPYSK